MPDSVAWWNSRCRQPVADAHPPDVVLVTGRQMRKPDPEIHLLVTALEQQSIGVVIAP
jgi:hypothetical protein